MKYIGGMLVVAVMAWHWVDARGYDNWTDELERVPAKYRPAVEAVELQPLSDYDRLTCVGRCPGEDGV